jgi:hypothetical protein
MTSIDDLVDPGYWERGRELMSGEALDAAEGRAAGYPMACAIEALRR